MMSFGFVLVDSVTSLPKIVICLSLTSFGNKYKVIIPSSGTSSFKVLIKCLLVSYDSTSRS